MKFDTVIGNPPYNYGSDIDFIYLAYKLCKYNVCMIVPAKWQGTDETAIGSSKLTYQEFRETFIKYINKVVFYPNSKDVFDIALGGGISYFLLNKEIQEEHLKKTVCKLNKTIESSWEELKISEISNVCLYNNNIEDIIQKCTGESLKIEQFKHVLYVSDNKSKIPFSNDDKDIAIISNNKVIGYIKEEDLNCRLGLEKYKVLLNCMRGGATDFDKSGKMQGLNKMLVAKPYQVGGGNYYVVKYFNTEQEVKSFLSYMNTKLVRFLYFLGVYATGVRNATFKFIPEPIVIDNNENRVKPEQTHIFTDREMYKTYGLTETQINIVESLIK